MTTTLVAVSGMSPAIVTETVWALARETPPVVPDEVVVVTTAKGRRDIEDLLLAPLAPWDGQTVWACLRRDVFALAKLKGRSAKLQLSVRVIDLPDAASGVRAPAEDLRTRDDNAQAADFIVQTLVPYADAADNRVVASIAGGRKTMGALLYAAMSLLGKETDRITHVLVSEPFENCREFFYPAQPHQELTAKPFGQPATPVRAADAVVELADIPFVPLRNKFEELNEPRRTFAGLVERYAKAERILPNRPPLVGFDADRSTLTVEGRPIPLAGRDLVVAAFLFARAANFLDHFPNRDDATGPLQKHLQSWKREHPYHQATTRLSGTLTADDLSKALAALRKKLKAAGLASAIPYLAPERDRIGFEMRQR